MEKPISYAPHCNNVLPPGMLSILEIHQRSTTEEGDPKYLTPDQKQEALACLRACAEDGNAIAQYQYGMFVKLKDLFTIDETMDEVIDEPIGRLLATESGAGSRARPGLNTNGILVPG